MRAARVARATGGNLINLTSEYQTSQIVENFMKVLAGGFNEQFPRGGADVVRLVNEYLETVAKGYKDGSGEEEIVRRKLSSLLGEYDLTNVDAKPKVIYDIMAYKITSIQNIPSPEDSASLDPLDESFESSQITAGMLEAVPPQRSQVPTEQSRLHKALADAAKNRMERVKSKLRGQREAFQQDLEANKDIYQNLVAGKEHFDWWLVNPYGNSGDEVGDYSVNEAKYLVSDFKYIYEDWDWMVVNYFLEMGIRIDPERAVDEALYDKAKFDKFARDPYKIRLEKVISSIKTIHAVATELDDGVSEYGFFFKQLIDRTPEIYRRIYSAFRIAGQEKEFERELKICDDGFVLDGAIGDLYRKNSMSAFVECQAQEPDPIISQSAFSSVANRKDIIDGGEIFDGSFAAILNALKERNKIEGIDIEVKKPAVFHATRSDGGDFKKIDIRESALDVVPLHNCNGHWVLMIADHQKKRLVCFDPKGNFGATIGLLDRHGKSLDQAKVKNYFLKDGSEEYNVIDACVATTKIDAKGMPYLDGAVQAQDDSKNCGIFCSRFAEIYFQNGQALDSEDDIKTEILSRRMLSGEKNPKKLRETYAELVGQNSPSLQPSNPSSSVNHLRPRPRTH